MSDTRNIPPMQYDSQGEGAPVILLPGGLTGWLSWIPHAETLAASRRVIRLQLHSVRLGLLGDPLPPDYSVNFEVAALGNTVDELGIKQADFAGWSYGCAVLLSFAIRHPARVRTLTLVEPPAYWALRSRGPLPGSVLKEEAFMQSLAGADLSEEQMVKFLHTVGLLPEEEDPRELPQWPLWYEHRRSLRIGGLEIAHEDSMELVRSFDRPVLLVKGEGTAESMDLIADVLADEFPQARVVTLPGGHAPHIVSMQAFLDLFIDFMSEADAAR